MKFQKTNLALELDRYVCGALVIFFHLLKPLVTRFEKIDLKEVREIVVSKFVGLGSIVLTQKLLYSLRKLFPKARITFVTFDMSQEVLKFMGEYLDDIVVVRTESLGSFVTSSFEAVRLLKKRKVDLYFDLEFFSRYSALISFFSSPKKSVGFESLVLFSRTSMYSHPAKFIPMIHIRENFINQLRTLGFEPVPGLDYPEIRLSQDLVERVRQKIKEKNLSENGFIVFNPSASEAGTYRVWSKEKWTELTRRAVSSVSSPVVFTGLAKDKPFVQSVMAELREAGHSVHDFTGLFSLEEFFGLLFLSRVVVTVDTGTPHFAIGMKKPTVILFGPESPERYGYTLPYCRNVYKRIFCSPCYNVHHGNKVLCRNENRCMTTIEPEEVMKEMTELLSYG